MQFSFSGREKAGLLSGPGMVATADLVGREEPGILPVDLRGLWDLTSYHEGRQTVR